MVEFTEDELCCGRLTLPTERKKAEQKRWHLSWVLKVGRKLFGILGRSSHRTKNENKRLLSRNCRHAMWL